MELRLSRNDGDKIYSYRKSISSILVTLAVSLTLVYVGNAGAATLGRLFFTPEERLKLEALRLRPTPPQLPPVPEKVVEKPVIVKPSPPPPPPLVESPPVTLNGIVSRANGENTVWINGKSSLEEDLDSQHIHVDTRNTDGHSVAVKMPGKNASVRMQPGETFQPPPFQASPTQAATYIDMSKFKPAEVEMATP